MFLHITQLPVCCLVGIESFDQPKLPNSPPPSQFRSALIVFLVTKITDLSNYCAQTPSVGTEISSLEKIQKKTSKEAHNLQLRAETKFPAPPTPTDQIASLSRFSGISSQKWCSFVAGKSNNQQF